MRKTLHLLFPSQMIRVCWCPTSGTTSSPYRYLVERLRTSRRRVMSKSKYFDASPGTSSKGTYVAEWEACFLKNNELGDLNRRNGWDNEASTTSLSPELWRQPRTTTCFWGKQEKKSCPQNAWNGEPGGTSQAKACWGRVGCKRVDQQILTFFFRCLLTTNLC